MNIETLAHALIKHSRKNHYQTKNPLASAMGSVKDGLAVKISWTNPTLKKARIYNYFEEAESIDK